MQEPNSTAIQTNSIQKEPLPWPAILAGALCALVICFACTLGFGMVHFRQRKAIALLQGGHAITCYTDAPSVGDFLTELKIDVQEADILSHETDALLENGMQITYERAPTVFVRQANGSILTMRARGTVGDVMAAIGIDPATSGVVTYPDPQSEIYGGMMIEIMTLSLTYESVYVTIPYETVYIEDAQMDDGESKIVQPGIDGVLEEIYEVTMLGNTEAARTLSDAQMITPVQNELVHYGTRKATPAPTATPKPTQTKTPTQKPTSTPKPTATPKPSTASMQTGSVNTAAGTVTVGGKTYTIKGTKVVEATAYTHTGNKTSTGIWPHEGIAATDKSIFPMGTVLYVEGWGLVVASDTGVKGDRIDIFMDSYDACIQWGRKSVTVYILEE